MLIQTIVRTLLHDGDIPAVGDAVYACGIVAPVDHDVSRGKIDLPYLAALPKSSRVFTTHHSPANLPCQGAGAGGRTLPPGVKVIHIIRDPRDSCIAMFNQMEEIVKCDFTPMWVESYAQRGGVMPFGGWMQQNKDWWDCYQQNPADVLWITFEECKLEPQQAVRKVAAFLGMEPSDAVVESVAKATMVDVMRTTLKQCPKLKLGADKPGKALECFTDEPELLEMFDRDMVQPAREYGMKVDVTG